MARYDDRGVIRLIIGIAALVVFFGAMLVLVVGLTFSVQVSGSSMQPTLHQGDRLEVNLFARHDIKRFDLVEAVEPATASAAGGAHIVKRVIGLPGDRIAIKGGAAPVLYLRPKGSSATYVVDNPTWAPRIGTATSACCGTQVTSLPDTGRKRWATVPADSYFVMGDNWGGSTDSRVFGPIPASGIKARLSLRILPLGRFGGIASHVRLVPIER